MTNWWRAGRERGEGSSLLLWAGWNAGAAASAEARALASFEFYTSAESKVPTEGSVLQVRPASFARARAAMPRIAAWHFRSAGRQSPQHQQNTRRTRKVGTRWRGWVLDVLDPCRGLFFYARTKSAAPALPAAHEFARGL